MSTEPIGNLERYQVLGADLLADWDHAAQPDWSGYHNGAGFALDNWEEIRSVLRNLVFS